VLTRIISSIFIDHLGISTFKRLRTVFSLASN
jgi:hypothetical protein